MPLADTDWDPPKKIETSCCWRGDIARFIFLQAFFANFLKIFTLFLDFSKKLSNSHGVPGIICNFPQFRSNFMKIATKNHRFAAISAEVSKNEEIS